MKNGPIPFWTCRQAEVRLICVSERADQAATTGVTCKVKNYFRPLGPPRYWDPSRIWASLGRFGAYGSSRRPRTPRFYSDPSSGASLGSKIVLL